MDKKDIYEHLAAIYLDSSLKKKKKSADYSWLFKTPLFIVIFLTFALVVILSPLINRNKPLNPSGIALILQPAALKINFRFDPARKEVYSISLNKLDLSKFRALGFSAKKVEYKKEPVSLRVALTNQVKEKSEIFFKNIPNKWRDYKINLSDFRNINEWSNMRNLSFIVEDLKAKDKRGVIYIANVRLLP